MFNFHDGGRWNKEVLEKVERDAPGWFCSFRVSPYCAVRRDKAIS